ncbi:GtrA family protein [Mycolicibacterium mengxianglii]|uniref:GtrA family protein n=1 Tax=Mycolicibacterium mengxianglii TaxID=2736649 RepID=UPI0018EF1BC3|nr:GtrA family protein [Mycolicibacterium mengxianglii]
MNPTVSRSESVLPESSRLPMVYRIVCFVLVGLVCLAVQFAIFHLLQPKLHLYAAEVVAFLTSAQLNFALSHLFTWRDRRGARRVVLRWAKFNLSALLAVTAVNGTTFWLLTAAGLPLWLAMLAANAVTALWSFSMNHFVVFRQYRDRSANTLERAL